MPTPIRRRDATRRADPAPAGTPRTNRTGRAVPGAATPQAWDVEDHPVRLADDGEWWDSQTRPSSASPRSPVGKARKSSSQSTEAASGRTAVGRSSRATMRSSDRPVARRD